MAYEIRALSFSEILDQGFRLVRNHFILLAGAGLVLYVPLTFVSQWMAAEMETAASSPDAALRVGLIGMGIGLVSILLSPIVTAAVTYALGEVYLGRAVTLGQALRRATSVFLPLMGTFFLYTLAVAGGFILLIIPGLYFMLAFMLVNQVVVLEGRYGLNALKRSRELMRGNLARGFGVFAASFLIMAVLSTGVEITLISVPVIYPVASAVVQAAGFAFYSAVGVLLYFDIRCRKEAFDLEHLSRIVEERSGRPSPVV